jgi:hypothetical protein
MLLICHMQSHDNETLIPMGCILLRGVHVNECKQYMFYLHSQLIRNITVASAGKTYIVYIHLHERNTRYAHYQTGAAIVSYRHNYGLNGNAYSKLRNVTIDVVPKST